MGIYPEATIPIWLWVAFIALILSALALDLGVFHRRPAPPSIRGALAWTGVWIAAAMAFNVGVYFLYGRSADAALKFFTAYVVEKSLSLDNIFVIAMIFAYFRVGSQYQHRVLFWGVLGALVLRGAMIGAGVALIRAFSWTTYLFGGLLLLTAVKMLIARQDNFEPEKSLWVRMARKIWPIATGHAGPEFFVRLDGRRAITPMFLVLILVETSDILFAVDSVPAVFAVTQEPFIVYTSNVFAILGLRSLYFALAGMMAKFRYLKMSIVFLLAYVGVKMMLVHHYPIPTLPSLAVIAGILSIGVVASFVGAKQDAAPPPDRSA